MQTKLLYLEDSYLKEMDAKILEIKEDGPGQWRMVLDQTVFYPIGGGQPTDQGKLTSGDLTYDVYLVMIKDGEVWHYLKSQSPSTVGSQLKGVVNWDRRYKNMKVHSAGHVVDFAMYILGYSPQKLFPLKGDHGKKSFIIYKGTLEKDIRGELENKSNELVTKNLKLENFFQHFEELKKEAIYLQAGLPTNKPLRTLKLETVGSVADGGTQVAATGEIGKITIPEITTSEDNTIIRYTVV